MHNEVTGREKSGDRRRGDAIPRLASSNRDNLTMALSTPRRSSVFLVSASLVGLLGFWLWWFKAGGSILPIPLIMRPEISVIIPQGRYIGVEARSGYPQPLELFLGIPYALSTAGERRFRPPVAVGNSDDTFDASNYGNVCPSGPPDNTHVSEDCLNLNIYRPKERSQNKLLPVLVHIHGGAFNGGFGHSRQVSNIVAWASEPFIGISFNYRLGAFGFLPSKAAEDEGLLNLGLKDQALLLEWVQKNIEAFGGNPDDVTLMGSSAGAHSIGHHLMREFDSSPPFHKAILESGATTARLVLPPTHALHEEQFENFIAKLGCNIIPRDQVIDALRKLNAVDIRDASEDIFQSYNPSIRWPFQPVIDGTGGMVPVRPIDAWESGKWNKVPILTGFNTNEGAMFVPKNYHTDKEFIHFFHTLLPGLTERDLMLLSESYPDPITHPDSKYVETREGFSLGAQFKRMEQAYAHFAYIAPVRQTARFASAGGAPVFLYHFAVNSSVVGGADHGNQNSFSTYNKEIRDRSESLEGVSGSMHAYWTSFITTGNPNTVRGRYPDRPQWPAYTSDDPKLVVFGEGNDEYAGGGNKGTTVKVTDSSWALEECKFWWERTKLFES